MKNLIPLFITILLQTGNLLQAQQNNQETNFTLYLMQDEESNTLNWSTGKEVNSSYFLIERSYDNKKFEVVNRVKAAGYALTKHSYELELGDKVNTANYYRVSLISMNGEIENALVWQLNEKNEATQLAEK